MFRSVWEQVIVGVLVAPALAALAATWGLVRRVPDDFRIPAGAVMAFDLRAGCPPSWRADFRDGQGKTIIGVGEGVLRPRGPHVPDGAPDVVALSELNFGDQGGAEFHRLTIPQMPRHSHEMTGLYGRKTGAGDRGFINYSIERNAGWRTSEEGGDSEQGIGEPHLNMPPYIPLYLCKKE